jgi:hypothetical protein
MATIGTERLPHSKLGVASCAAFGLAVYLMLTLNAMLGNLALLIPLRDLPEFKALLSQ